jgi:hypothetical protein
MEKFTITPNGINHNSKPAFVANWFNGDIKAEENDRESFYYEGSGENEDYLSSGCLVVNSSSDLFFLIKTKENQQKKMQV